MADTTVCLSVRLLPKAKRKLDTKARSKGYNTSDYVRKWIAEELKMRPDEVFDSAPDAQMIAQDGKE